MNDDPATYELAYTEAVRAVEAQSDSFDGARDRAGTILAAATIVSAVIVAQPTHNGYTLVAVVALVVAAILSLWVVLPATLRTTTDVHKLLADYVEGSPSATIAETHRSLAYYMQVDWRENEAKLNRRNYAILAAAILVVIEIIAAIAGSL
jgi:hypothetical protein